MAHVHREFEASFDVDPGTPVPDLSQLTRVHTVREQQGISYEATYFDTAELILARSRVAVRHRSGGADSGWHIKRAVAGYRQEMQWPGDDANEVPYEIYDALEDLLGGHSLIPVATIVNERGLSTLHDHSNSVIAEFCDDRVRAVRLSDQRVQTWREWEIELAGTEDAADDIHHHELLAVWAKQLETYGAAPAQTASKLARALNE